MLFGHILLATILVGYEAWALNVHRINMKEESNGLIERSRQFITSPCPTGADAPVCGDPGSDCKDKDGQCTAGEHEGCECKGQWDFKASSTLDFSTSNPTRVKRTLKAVPRELPTYAPVINYPDSECPGVDIQGASVRGAVEGFCAMYAGKVVGEGDTYENAKLSGDPIWYHVTASWKTGCSGLAQRIDYPLPGISCVEVFMRDWLEAVGNNGRGGWSSAACMHTSVKIQCD